MINTNIKNIVFLIDCSKSMQDELEIIAVKLMKLQKEGKEAINIDYYIYGEACMKLDRLDDLQKSIHKVGNGSRTLSAIMYCIKNYKKGIRLVLITNSFPNRFHFFIYCEKTTIEFTSIFICYQFKLGSSTFFTLLV